jgi:two-component system phosphate regulon response regulator PhoB
MLSARSEETDKVRGLETGADDYIVKPYSVAELLARLRTQLRRIGPPRSANGWNSRTSSSIWPSTACFRDGGEPDLGPTEFRLLTAFMERPGRVWSREQLLDRVWGRDIYVDSRTVDVHVGRLRKALCPPPGICARPSPRLWSAGLARRCSWGLAFPPRC